MSDMASSVAAHSALETLRRLILNSCVRVRITVRVTGRIRVRFRVSAYIGRARVSLAWGRVDCKTM